MDGTEGVTHLERTIHTGMGTVLAITVHTVKRSKYSSSEKSQQC